MDATSSAARPGGPGRVLGTFFGLLLFLGLLAWIGSGLLVSPVDGAAKQREYFGERALPFGLVLDQAKRLPTRDVLLVFEPGEAGERAPREPVEVVLIEYASRTAVEPLFRPADGGGPSGPPGPQGPQGPHGTGGGDASARLVEWERDKSFAWHTTMKRGEIAWGAWSSKLLIERRFAKGGGWHEEARVDLSSLDRALVLFAHWPAETPVDEAALRELLAAVEVPR
jgi:hypothetical protein